MKIGDKVAVWGEGYEGEILTIIDIYYVNNCKYLELDNDDCVSAEVCIPAR